MASQRMKNRLYWALVNALADKDEAAVEVLQFWYRGAIRGDSDTMILSSPALQTHLGAMEELHAPAGVRQLQRARPIEIRQYVDALRETYEKGH